MKVIAWPAFKTRSKNPYNWLLYSQMREQGVTVEEFSPVKLLRKHYDIFHLHWPVETILDKPSPLLSSVRLTSLFALIDLMRLRGTRIVWTIHNLQAHENSYPRLSAWFWREFLPRIDGYINLSEAGKAAAEERFPLLKKCSGFTVPHGHYREVYPNEVNRTCARSTLGIAQGCRVLVFLGQIRPYKNVPHLIRVFRELSDPNLVLVVAGKPYESETHTEVLEATASDPRVKLFLKFVSDKDIQLYLNAADLVVLPFRDVLNSGSALLALSYNCPVLVPAKGAMSELQAQVGEAWVKTFSGELTAEILCEGLSWVLHTSRPESTPLEELNWCQLSEKTVEVYRAVCKR